MIRSVTPLALLEVVRETVMFPDSVTFIAFVMPLNNILNHPSAHRLWSFTLQHTSGTPIHQSWLPSPGPRIQ